MSKEKHYYITTPIYYPNDNLHLGHTYTTIIADTLKKYKEAEGYDVWLTTGTDEHGQKLLEAAQKAGKGTLEYIDPIVDTAKELWKKLDIHYDAFVRSTDPVHEKNVQEIFKKLYDKGDIYKSTYKGNYCIPCEAFWTESQLVDGKCPDCGRAVEYHEEESYFFKLSEYRDRLLDLYENHPEFLLPESRKNEMINNFLKDGLQDLSVSRTSFNWGVPVPFDDKHIIYVWIDALSCYLTGIGYGTDEEKFNKYWPASIHLVGKEIVRFHAIIWPALLMAMDLPLPKRIMGHGWILFDNDKMSKSKGNVMYAEPIIELYGNDALRYFILREFTFGQDGNFTSEKLLNRINSDLANDLGNLVSRTIAMVEKYFGGLVPEVKTKEAVDDELIETATSAAAAVADKMDKLDFSGALESIWKVISRANKYIDETTPWVLGNNGDTERLSTVLYNLTDTLRIIATLINPFLTESSLKIFKQLGMETDILDNASKFALIKPGTKVEKIENIFPRLDVKKELEKLDEANTIFMAKKLKSRGIEAPKEEAVEEVEEITIDEFAKVKMRTGVVLTCEPHPKADKLYVFKIQLGDEVRQIVSGIRKHYKPEDLISKTVVIVDNLKAIKLRGVESRGMILTAEDSEGNLSLLTTMAEIESGSKIS